MLSKKRQIMFEVLGHRARPSRTGEVSVQVRPDSEWTEAPRKARAPKSRARAPRRAASGAASWRGGAWWFGAAGVVLLLVIFVVYRMNRMPGQKAPVLQRNAEQPLPPSGGPSESWSADTLAVCAMSREYRNKTEHKLAKEKVQEIVDFLGYHADPDFRDVRGKDHPGKDPGTGSFRVYVGSASHKSDLIPVRDKLTALVWKGSKPFQQATVRLIERVASPSAKEASHER